MGNTEKDAVASVVGFIAELWSEPPCRQHLQGLPAVAGVFPSFSDALLWANDQLDEWQSVWQKHLAIPGSQAFLPYETSHLPPNMSPRGPERLALIAGLYKRAGFPLEPWTHYPADHLGHELRFLAALLRHQALCEQRQEHQGAANVKTWRQGFLQDHLQAWLPAFVAHVERVTTNAFFAALAQITLASVLLAGDVD